MTAGLGAQAARLPGGWLLGPMAVAIAAGALRPRHAQMPPWALKIGQAAIGLVVAGVFRPSVLPLLTSHWLPVLLVVGGTLLVSVAAGIVLARVTALDRETAAFGTLPGGASSMIAMSVSLGADTRLVALMQYIRLVLSVGSASLLARFVLHPAGGSRTPPGGMSFGPAGPQPWTVYVLSAAIAVVGAWLGPRLRLPAGALLGPLLLGVAVGGLTRLHPALPPGVPQAAYVLMGLYVGLRFDRASLRAAGRLLPVMLVNTLILMAVCAALGGVLAALTHTDYLTAYLATSPGGLDSITVVALNSGADVSLMLAVQMMRLLTIVLLGPIVVRGLLRRGRSDDKKTTDRNDDEDCSL